MQSVENETRLNIGAGATVIEGFTPIDRRLGTEAYPLANADDSVEEIRASHILEHFSFDDVPKVLAEWVRVLKPGGEIRISVPDADKCLVSDDANRLRYLMGGQTDHNDYHKSAFDAPTLAQFMADAGIAEIAPWHSENTDTAAHPISLNLMGRKPRGTKKQVKICGLMSVPRVGWQDAMHTIKQAAAQFCIPIRSMTGVYWGQGMQKGMEAAVKAGTDWILTIDYDSMITAAHIQGLIDDLASTPEADAVCALQRRRRSDGPLCVIESAVGGTVEVDGTPIPITTGHFGLTLIKCDAIARMPKPWFCEEPSDDGTWGEGHIDEDIWFWREWNKAGNKLFLSPSVSIGHLELMVAEFDEENKPRHTHVDEWRKREGLM